jgi:SAM-dependent methyltransferase
VAVVRRLATALAPGLPDDRIRTGFLEELDFPDAYFDTVIASAVLHFATDPQHFGQMVGELWRVLRPGGTLFARMASRNGIGDRIQPLGDGRYALPDGTERFLVDDELLVGMTNVLGGELLDSIKTVNVQGLRCMSTWVVRKSTQEQVST